MSVTTDLDFVISKMPSIKKIVIDLAAWDRLAFELLQIQRFGVNGPAEPGNIRGPIIFRDVEIWKDRNEKEVPSED